MAISAAFLVNGNTNPAAHSVAYGATVSMTLLSTSGANSIVWEVLGSSHTDVPDTTLVYSGTPNGQTCTFTFMADPGGSEGRSVRVRCTVTDSAGNQSRQSAVVGVLNGNSLLPIAAGEEQERSETHGWAPEVNKALASTGGGGGGGYTTVQDEGVSVTARTTMNFTGAGVSVADTGGKTTVTIPGGTTVNLPANPADDGKVAIASGGNLSYALLSNSNIANATIALAKMAAIAALSVVANGTNASASPTAVAGTDGQALRVSGTTLGFGSLDLSLSATVGSSKLALTNFADGSARSVLGRASNTSGVQASIAGGGANTVLVDSGTSLSFTTLGLSSLSNVAALTVLGNGTNASAAVTALAGTTDQVMRVSSAGTTLGFGAINLASSSAVSGLLAFANIANGSARSVFGRSANSSGVQASIAGAGANTVLVDNGTTIAFAAVPVAALASISALSVLGNGTNSSAVPTALTSATDGDVMRRSGTTVGFGAPNFAAQDITTTGDLVLGATPATSGDLRVNQGFALNGRDSGNTANVAVLRWGTTANTVILGSSNSGFNTSVFGDAIAISGVGSTTVSVNGTPTATFASGSFNTVQPLTIGSATVGTSGNIRIANATTLATARNNANSADLTFARTNSSDGMFLGEGAASYSIGDNKINIGTNIEISVQQFRFDNAVTTPSIVQEDRTTNGGTGETLTIQAQNETGTTSTGGGLDFRSGTGTSGNGTITLRNGSTVVLTVASTLVTSAQPIAIGSTTAASGNIRLANGGIIRGRNNANSADLDMLTTGSTDQIILGNSSDCSVLLASQNVLLRPAGTDRVQVTDTVFEWRLTTVRFDTAVTSPVINQELDTSASVTCDTLIMQAQSGSGTTNVTAGALNLLGGDATGASGTRTGGAWFARSGTGATADGNVTIQRGNTAVFSATSTATAVGNGTTLVEGASISGRNVVSLCRGSAVSATQMPSNTGSGVVYLASAGTIPTAVPVGGCLIYAAAGGEFCPVSTDGGLLTTKIGDGTRGIEFKAGGATVPGFNFYVNNAAKCVNLDTGILNFDSASTGTANDWFISYRGNSVISLNTSKLAFFGGAAISKPTVTGAKSGNAALTSLLTQLAALGLLTDSST